MDAKSARILSVHDVETVSNAVTERVTERLGTKRVGDTVRFTIPGQPVGKARARFSSKSGHAYTPEKTANYETLVKLCYRQQVGNIAFDRETPLWMCVELYMQIPKNVSKRRREAMVGKKCLPIKKPDCSNVLKSIEDGLNGIAYADDSQIVSEKIEKYYGEYPEAIVKIGKVGG